MDRRFRRHRHLFPWNLILYPKNLSSYSHPTPDDGDFAVGHANLKGFPITLTMHATLGRIPQRPFPWLLGGNRLWYVNLCEWELFVNQSVFPVVGQAFQPAMIGTINSSSE